MGRISKINGFDVLNYSFIVAISCVMLYPFINVLAVSLSSYSAYVANPLRIWPSDFTLSAYRDILTHPVLWTSYRNTIVVTVTAVTVSLLLYIITAYPLSKRHLKGRKLFMLMIIFTMMFNGGLIPNFYLIRSLGLLDTLMALMVPMLLTGFNVILMKTFMEQIPEELEEAARMDGASDPYILAKIIVPLSKPIIATLGLFTAVAYWNNFFNAIVYIRSVSNWPLMLFLREIIQGAKMMEITGGENALERANQFVPPETLQYATLMIVTIPILCVYPFLQKYFVKGIMLGSVKG